ncbi:MAG: aminotransferase class V-fold PLP-dependent enzyme [Candidatus Methanodesulfokora sp.]|jgi:cysteine desulfurase/selenocysteine lyase
MYDVERVREQFPVLRNRKVIYLDNAATSLTPDSVINAIVKYYSMHRANVHRGLHKLSMEASRVYDDAHAKVASFIGAKPQEIIFTSGTTEALNLIASGLKLKRGDPVVVTMMEHHANLLPWYRLRKDKGVEIRFVPVSADGRVDMETYQEMVKGAKVVSVAWVSNVLGTISPVEEMVKIARENNAIFGLDGAQAVPHMPVNVKKLDIDFLAFSAHKMCGPTGIGALYLREDLAEEMEPFKLGGDMISDVTLDGYMPAELPKKFEAGTPPIAEAFGFSEAISFLEELGVENIMNHVRRITKEAVKALSEMKKVRIYGPAPGEERGGLISFTVDGMNHHDVAAALDELSGICVRSGHHCALPLHKYVLGVNGTVRASFYLYNTMEEVETLINTLNDIIG